MESLEADSQLRGGFIGATMVSIVVSDPEVLAALAEYPEGLARTNFLVTALKVGVLSLKAARGSLDSDTLRREGDRLLEELGNRLTNWRCSFEERVTGSLEHYFDPQKGTFTDRVHRLTKSDGDLANVVKQQVHEAGTNLSKVFDQFIGENSLLFRMLDPTGDNQLVASLQRSLDGVIEGQNQTMLGQFSLDNKTGALARFLDELTSKHGDLNKALSQDMQGIVAEFSLDNENSALSRLVARVEAAQSSITAELSLDNEDSALQRLQRMLRDNHQVLVRQQSDLAERLNTAIESMNVRRTESAKSTRHGVEFEETLCNHLRELTKASGDVLEETGSTTGLKPNCKVGDYVITIGPEKIASGARIVIEAKESSSYDLRNTLEEADTARINRRADICIFVHSVQTADASIPTFQRFGRDVVVKWDPDDDALDVWLEAAIMVATALSAKAAAHDKKDAASFEKIDRAIERVRKHLEGFEEIHTSANSAKGAAEKILNRARIMQEGLSGHIQSIIEEIEKVKEDTNQSGGVQR